MFLRFLIARGDCGPGWITPFQPLLSGAFLHFRSIFPPMTLERLIDSCDNSLLGARDRAILLLIARLGLRAGDVRALSLTISNGWKEGRRVRQGPPAN